MARFKIIAALVMVVMAIAVAEASSSSNPQQSERCRREIQGVQMNECMRYLEESQRGLLAMYTNPQMPPQECCQAMREMSEECRCEAVRQMMQQMQQGQQYQGEQMQEMMEKARQLPGMCGMSPQTCRISSRDVEEDNDRTSSSEKCRREVQGVQMSPCMRYLEESQRGLASKRNPQTAPPQQCCQAMRKVSEECRCEAVRQMMEQMQQGQEYQGEQMQEMMEKARQLPGMCGMSPQSCSMSTRDGNTSEKCRQEVQGVQMNPCMRYLEKSQRGLASKRNPQTPPPQQCCQAMGQLSEECRCEAVRQMMQQMEQGEQYQGEQMQEVMEKARQLPGMCGMSPQSCQMSEHRSYY